MCTFMYEEDNKLNEIYNTCAVTAVGKLTQKWGENF